MSPLSHTILVINDLLGTSQPQPFFTFFTFLYFNFTFPAHTFHLYFNLLLKMGNGMKKHSNIGVAVRAGPVNAPGQWTVTSKSGHKNSH